MSATFVDDVVLGLPEVGSESKFGPVGVVVDGVNAAAAIVRFDDHGYRPLRRALAARPGASVDALTQLAATLSRMVDPADPTRALMQVALGAEVSAAQFAVVADPGGDR